MEVSFPAAECLKHYDAAGRMDVFAIVQSCQHQLSSRKPYLGVSHNASLKFFTCHLHCFLKPLVHILTVLIPCRVKISYTCRQVSRYMVFCVSSIRILHNAIIYAIQFLDESSIHLEVERVDIFLVRDARQNLYYLLSVVFVNHACAAELGAKTTTENLLARSLMMVEFLRRRVVHASHINENRQSFQDFWIACTNDFCFFESWKQFQHVARQGFIAVERSTVSADLVKA
mmetsp:Transcript_7126/g.13167  ORF Transcript_7126/g.13167 Transcript_7126/m.13167 type:complete len:230 (+) Transcript_7126:446-1135(+)